MTDEIVLLVEVWRYGKKGKINILLNYGEKVDEKIKIQKILKFFIN